MMKLWDLIKKRPFIQAVTAILSNPYLQNFSKGTIYKGKGKNVCIPGLNCYSCPGAVGACPIGSLQAVIGDRKHNFSYYVFGILILFGVIFGRLICGFFCPFGLLQDLLYKIPTLKLKISKKIDKPLRFLKYGIFLVMVIILPLFLTNEFGTASPYFCKWICPAGTLEGGIPLLILNESLRNMAGFLFHWKIVLLILMITASIFIYRPFCKYICPLGAIYSLFNKFSFYQMDVDQVKCTGCRACEHQCKMNVEITKDINNLECIRCGECMSVCSQGAITAGFKRKADIKKKEQKYDFKL